jgi:hypothetical protein
MIQTPLFLPQLMEDKMQIMTVFLTDMKEVLVRIQTIGTQMMTALVMVGNILKGTNLLTGISKLIYSLHPQSLSLEMNINYKLRDIIIGITEQN